MTDKEIVHLDLNAVTKIDKSDEARKTGFNELVIPAKYRKLVVSLVESHASGSKGKTDTAEPILAEEPIRQIDLVRGKGLGLIILLREPSLSRSLVYGLLTSYTLQMAPRDLGRPALLRQ